MPALRSRTQRFQYQLDCLKLEMEMIERIIARMDETTQGIKNWAIVTWAGSIGLLLKDPDLRKYIIFTVVLPLIFWYLDGIWRKLQRRSVYRNEKIMDFLNSEDFAESCRKQELVNFVVMDPVGRQYKGTKKYREALKLKHILGYGDIRYFYEGLTLISILLGGFFLLEAFGLIKI